VAGCGVIDRLETARLINTPELLTALSMILASDGELHDRERDLISKLSTRRGVSTKQLKLVFATAQAADSRISIPQDLQQARVFMDHLIQGALIDGRITHAEQKLLKHAAGQLGWSKADFKLAMARNRRELHTQAKQIIQQHRRRS